MIDSIQQLLGNYLTALDQYDTMAKHIENIEREINAVTSPESGFLSTEDGNILIKLYNSLRTYQMELENLRNTRYNAQKVLLAILDLTKGKKIKIEWAGKIYNVWSDQHVKNTVQFEFADSAIQEKK